MKTFLEWMEEHTLLTHYRVEDPALMHQLSGMDGVEIEADDDEQGGLITVDSITYAKTAAELKGLAAQGKIRLVAGAATQDMTGKARAMGTNYINSPEG